MRIIERLRKDRAITIYLARCPALLRARYGADTAYAPARILTTLRVHRLPASHAEYACAMFAALEDYVRWARAPRTEPRHAEEARRHPYRHAERPEPLPSREWCVARFSELRREVAETYNGGVYRFLPEPEGPPEQWVPLTNDRAIGPMAWLL